MIPRMYINTSVVGGIFDKEFEFHTKQFFNRVFKGEVVVLVSDLLEEELLHAPQQISSFFKSLPRQQIENIVETTEAINLANQYIAEKVVGPTSLADCRHIAVATVNEADVLVSWNFKHIVNLARIKGYNSVNLKAGFRRLEIMSPKELEGV